MSENNTFEETTLVSFFFNQNHKTQYNKSSKNKQILQLVNHNITF